MHTRVVKYVYSAKRKSCGPGRALAHGGMGAADFNIVGSFARDPRPSILPWRGFGWCRRALLFRLDKPRQTTCTADTRHDYMTEACSCIRGLRGYRYANRLINAISCHTWVAVSVPGSTSRAHLQRQSVYETSLPISTI